VGWIVLPADSPVQSEVGIAAERSVGFGAAVCLCILAAALLSIGAFSHPARTQESRPAESVNPNTASASSLVRLPGIGRSKAQAIIDYRERFRVQYSGAPAFHRPVDLTRVSGIGPHTVEAIAEWLDFGDRPDGGARRAARPSSD
jgi:competence ComEA-like helix-hairpin-helix protein